MAIPFTQYLMPDGRNREVNVDRTPEIEAIAARLITDGVRFECEMLPDYVTVSLTAEYEDDNIAIEVVENGPDVLSATDSLVRAADKWMRDHVPAA